jgi:hypothetical protein
LKAGPRHLLKPSAPRTICCPAASFHAAGGRGVSRRVGRWLHKAFSYQTRSLHWLTSEVLSSLPESRAAPWLPAHPVAAVSAEIGPSRKHLRSSHVITYMVRTCHLLSGALDRKLAVPTTKPWRRSESSGNKVVPVICLWELLCLLTFRGVAWWPWWSWWS